MIVIPASLSSAFIHMAGMTIHIALESTIHIAGIRNLLGERRFDALTAFLRGRLGRSPRLGKVY
jgi:hypothetical protein